MQTHERRLEADEQPKKAAAKPASNLRQAVLSLFNNVTPVRLGLLLFLNFLLSAILCLFGVVTVQQHFHAVKTVGIDAAPSVIAAFEIKSGISAMDADLVNELLYPPGQEEAQQMNADFEKWRISVCKQLVLAAKNITYGSAEQEPIENIQIALGKYESLAQKARDYHREMKENEAIAAYRDAQSTLQIDILPNASALEKADSVVLEATYADEKAASNLSRGFLLVLGLSLVSMIFYTQWFLTSRFHRRICPPLILAVVSLMFVLNHLTASLSINGNALVLAKEDAYDSVLALLNARANAFEASAASARALLDHEHAEEHNKMFGERMSSIARVENDHSFPDTIGLAEKQIQASEKINLPGFRGSLADELNNIRFAGESDAALDALKQFSEYKGVSSTVCELEKNGAHAEAVKSCLSYSPSGSKFSFTRFDDALLRTLKINQVQMDKAVNSAFKALKRLDLEIEFVCLLTVICVYLGLLPRMEEYVHCDASRAKHKH